MKFGDTLFSDKPRSTCDSYFVVHVAGGTATNPVFSTPLIKVRPSYSLQVFREFRFHQPYPTIPNHTQHPNHPAITQDLENGADLNNGDTFGEDWALQSWSYEEAVAANQRLASSYHPVLQWTRDEGNLTHLDTKKLDETGQIGIDTS